MSPSIPPRKNRELGGGGRLQDRGESSAGEEREGKSHTYRPDM